MHIVYPAVVSALLFSIGVYGVLARRNTILVLMSVELMLNAVNLNLVAFDVWLRDRLHSGQVLTLFVIVIAAAEVGLGLAIVLALYRNRRTVDIDQLRDLAEPADDPPALISTSASAPTGVASASSPTRATSASPPTRATTDGLTAPARTQASLPGDRPDPTVAPTAQPSHGAPDSDGDSTADTPEPREHRGTQGEAQDGHGSEQPVNRGGRR
ncbi:NADH-quinone oxidoreductase subunit NuoK [Nonomuraea sp. G32]|nr:NADH-quinone oxidoreductase subunit NuoK [Nonomuraea sp. G32]MDP4500849.1 NADH-quinone oxidoreductase subunit NuoK [Nonomuraea sp. G32]